MPRIHARKRQRHVGWLPAAGIALAFGVVDGARAADVAGNVMLTSDYVWRGSTQTRGHPAAQAGVRVTGDSGLYASLWASNVEFAAGTGANSECDFTVGWSRDPGDDLALDVNVLHYRYPSTTTDLDWTELNGTVTWKRNYWASLGYSSDALGLGGNGMHGLVGARLPVDDRFRVEANAGYYRLEDLDGEGRRDSYAYGSLSAVWAITRPGTGPVFEARLTVHATDTRAGRFFGDDFAGKRLEAALQASF